MITKNNQVKRIGNWLPDVITDIEFMSENVICNPEHFSDTAKKALINFRRKNYENCN